MKVHLWRAILEGMHLRRAITTFLILVVLGLVSDNLFRIQNFPVPNTLSILASYYFLKALRDADGADEAMRGSFYIDVHREDGCQVVGGGHPCKGAVHTVIIRVISPTTVQIARVCSKHAAETREFPFTWGVSSSQK